MPIYLRQSTASQEVPLGYFVDSTDGNTEETALSIANTDIKIWKTGATTLANKNSGGATHISNGIYYTVLDATDTDTIGPMVIFVHVAGALTVRVECMILDEAMYDWWTGTAAPLAPTTAGRTLDVSAGGEAGVDWANVGSPTTAVDLSGTTIKTTQKVDVDTIKTQAVTCAAGVTVRADVGAAAAPGAANGMLIGGSNAATTFSGLTTGALSCTTVTASGAVAFQSTFAITGNMSLAAGLTITQSTLNGHGITVTGNGTGAGFNIVGGATGYGLRASGGGTSGAAVYLTATSGEGILISPTSGRGIAVISNDSIGIDVNSNSHALALAASGTNAHGLIASGGSAGTSDGIRLNAGTGGVGLRVDTVTASGAVSFGSTFTITGALTATNAGNDIRGISVATGGIVAASFAAGAIDATAIAANAIGASELAADAVTEIQAGLSTLDAAGVRAAVGLAAANLDTQLSTIDDFLDTEIAAIKAKTDGLTFTVAGFLDCNVQYVNDVQVTGTGAAGNEWGPV